MRDRELRVMLEHMTSLAVEPFQEQVRRLTRQDQVNEGTLRQVRGTLDSLQGEVQKLKTGIYDRGQEIRSLKDRLTVAERKRDKAEAEEAAKDEVIDNLTSDLDTFRTRAEQLENVNRGLNEMVEVWKQHAREAGYEEDE